MKTKSLYASFRFIFGKTDTATGTTDTDFRWQWRFKQHPEAAGDNRQVVIFAGVPFGDWWTYDFPVRRAAGLDLNSENDLISDSDQIAGGTVREGSEHVESLVQKIDSRNQFRRCADRGLNSTREVPAGRLRTS